MVKIVAEYVGIELTMEFLFRNRLEGLELKDAGIVHEHIHRVEDFSVSSNIRFTSSALETSA